VLAVVLEMCRHRNVRKLFEDPQVDTDTILKLSVDIVADSLIDFLKVITSVSCIHTGGMLLLLRHLQPLLQLFACSEAVYKYTHDVHNVPALWCLSLLCDAVTWSRNIDGRIGKQWYSAEILNWGIFRYPWHCADMGTKIWRYETGSFSKESNLPSSWLVLWLFSNWNRKPPVLRRKRTKPKPQFSGGYVTVFLNCQKWTSPIIKVRNNNIITGHARPLPPPSEETAWWSEVESLNNWPQWTRVTLRAPTELTDWLWLLAQSIKPKYAMHAREKQRTQSIVFFLCVAFFVCIVVFWSASHDQCVLSIALRMAAWKLIF